MDVARPVWPKAFSALALDLPNAAPGLVLRGQGNPRLEAQAQAAATLQTHRWQIGRRVWPAFSPPPFDEASLRLVVAVHNLFALGHPSMLNASARTRDVVIGFAVDLARLGPPPAVAAAVERYTLFSRFGDIERNEYQVRNWLGVRHFVGRAPPPRLSQWAKLRKVQVSHQKRNWLRDVGVPNDARRLWETLAEANPLMEAMSPARLDPPVSWDHLFGVLRFTPLARAVAAQLVGQGLAMAVEPLATALFLHCTAKEGTKPAATPEAAVFGVTFLAHVYWLHLLTRAAGDAGPALTALLAAAAEEPRLVVPSDVAATAHAQPLVDLLSVRLGALRQRARGSAAFAQEAQATVAMAKRGLPAEPRPQGSMSIQATAV